MASAVSCEVALRLVFELLQESDLARCSMTCRDWNVIATCEQDARARKDVERWERLRLEWEQQHADWQNTRAQNRWDDCVYFDTMICRAVNPLDEHTDQQEVSVILENLEHLYKCGGGTYLFNWGEMEDMNLARIAERCVLWNENSSELLKGMPTAAHVVKRAIGMGPGAKDGKLFVGHGGNVLPTEVVRIVGGHRVNFLFGPYDVGHLQAIFELLLEPMAFVSADFALEWNSDMLNFLFSSRDRPVVNRLYQKRTINLLLWSGIGDRPSSIWQRCEESSHRESLCLALSDFIRLFLSSDFMKVFLHERSALLRRQMIDHARQYHSNDFMKHAKTLFASRHGRKVFMDMLRQSSEIRNLFWNSSEVGGLFELARMRERGILRFVMKRELQRARGLRDNDGNCLLLYAAGCRGCTTGVISDLLAAGFDPHRRNLHGQTACERYRAVLRKRSKLNTCLKNDIVC